MLDSDIFNKKNIEEFKMRMNSNRLMKLKNHTVKM